MPKPNLITVFNWACNMIDTQELSMSEQNLIFHLLKILNRNMWEPIKISNNRLADFMHSDAHRTVKPALEKLIKKKIICRNEEGELNFAYGKQKKSASKSDGSSAKTSPAGHQQNLEPADNGTERERDLEAALEKRLTE